MNSTLRQKLFLSAASIGLALAAPAFAQDAAEDEIVVTATQRSQRLQDVPIAVTAVSAEQLERSGVSDITNLSRVSSSFRMSAAQTETGAATIRLRGVGTTGNNIGLESAVGVFLDGVYLSRPGVALAELGDVERLEVLRGPQGTLFGRNTSAGALTITTRRPDLGSVEGFANASYGDFGATSVQGGVSIPIDPGTFAVRLSGAMRQRDGILDSTTGAESGTRDRYLVRAQGLLEPAPEVSIRLIADYSESDEECCDAVMLRDTPLVGLGAYTATGLPANGGAVVSGPSAFEDRRSNAEEFQNDTEQWGFSLQVDWDIGDAATLTYIGAYRDFYSSSVQEADFVGLDVFSFGRGSTAAPGAPEAYDQIATGTHELRLQGRAWDDRLDWLVGYYHSQEDIEALQTGTLGADHQQYVSANIILAPGVLAGFGPNPMRVFAGGVNSTGNFATNLFGQSGDSSSIFTHNIFSVTDRLDLTVGVRYVEENKSGFFDQLAAQSGACVGVLGNLASIPAALRPAAVGFTCFPFTTQANLPGAGTPAGPPTPVEFNNVFEDEELVYTANAAYELTPDVNTYFSFTHGFKSGGFNLDPTAAVRGSDPRFRSELVDAYEFGVKTQLFDRRVRANLAVFQMEFTDFQVLEFTGVQFLTFNVPEVLVNGAELEIDARLTDSLSLSTAITYSDARYPDDCAAGLSPPNPNASNLCGSLLTNAPEWSANFGATYEHQITDSGWRLFADGAVRYETERRTTTQPKVIATGNPLFGDFQPENTKVDLRFGLRSPDDQWSLEFWGYNIADEQTKNVTFNVPLRGTGDGVARGTFIEEPRTYGVTLRAEF